MQHEEQQLIEQSLSGNEAAFQRLYHKYVQAMYHTCLRMLGRPEDAEDVLQDAFVRVYQNLGQFKGESTLGAWIKRIVVNTALNFLRKQNRVHFLALEEARLPESDDNQDVGLDPGIPTGRIHEAIKQLPDGCRAVLNLYLLEGYPHKEIAQIMGIKESTSKTQYRRAKMLLRDQLKHDLNA